MVPIDSAWSHTYLHPQPVLGGDRERKISGPIFIELTIYFNHPLCRHRESDMTIDDWIRMGEANRMWVCIAALIRHGSDRLDLGLQTWEKIS